MNDVNDVIVIKMKWWNKNNIFDNLFLLPLQLVDHE